MFVNKRFTHVHINKHFTHVHINKRFTHVHILKSERCFNVKSSTYYFHVKMKILTDFQIFISVSLINLSLPVLNNVFMLLCSKEKKLSANIIGTSTFEELALSLVPNKK